MRFLQKIAFLLVQKGLEIFLYLLDKSRNKCAIKGGHIYTRTAPNLFLTNNQTKLIWYVPVIPRLLLPYKFAYGNYMSEETNASFGRFWKGLSPKSPRPSSSCIRINFLSSNRLFRAKVRQVRQRSVVS